MENIVVSFFQRESQLENSESSLKTDLEAAITEKERLTRELMTSHEQEVSRMREENDAKIAEVTKQNIE